jgi:hypothetical protein
MTDQHANENDSPDPQDEEYRAHSGGAAVAICLLIMAAACILQGAIYGY